ncbi:MAG: hypothetical protein MPEBLZ_04266 [Candidatus Methanoperedens nitroreducens]|uniref:Uncharacterized protein n=1 Tax=Candidatus Methanoperedens nitratireducens TaxID=1392998 RepID=A0A0P8C3Q1_9EURY|nr:hypothetical protein [Candidatus Methanoperedens sp. BLZ2]KAB2945007.1 MAG: hypothetical protein F9K14_12280 [Candidatus Methanoperedens sp.]KPQ41174.1 MAG: hypothetical protein MPEBLZ_04266 [Candidatus Methanoperedens sp. BLZ1]MBZ0176585.1 hypothetical protein [Candidatus Methanoperedens nitroreducens]MCX9080308.1 hypothetical protein [Candidatus Methanoperedens sp.]
MDKTNDRKVLDFLMDDGTWEKSPGKKTVQKQQEIEKQKQEVSPSDKITLENKKSETMGHINVAKVLTKDIDAKTDVSENEFGEVDYAILKSVTLGFKTIKEIAEALQIRTMVIEKHIYKLIQDGFIKYFQYCVITSRGKEAIEDFVKNNPEDVWMPIDEFILSVIEQKKERNLKFQKMVDLILLASMIVLIILIIYFGLIA